MFGIGGTFFEAVVTGSTVDTAGDDSMREVLYLVEMPSYYNGLVNFKMSELLVDHHHF